MKPIYLPGHMTVNNIVADFTADTTADAKWYRYGTGTALNTPDPETTNGEFTLFTCGEDSLMVVLSGSISCERRVMPLNVAAANIKIDTILACSAYAWKPTNDHTEILDEPGFYSYSPEGEDCDSTKAIELFFSTPLETTLAKQDACMDSYWSKYGHNKGYDTLSNLANGLYYMTITDSLGCYQDKQVKVNDPINPKMTLRAKGFKKVYDGIPVSLNSINVVEYDDNWKVPERAEYYVTSDQWRQLALRIGDSLIVSLLKPDTMIKDVDSVRNIIDGWSIKDAETGKDKTCLYHFYPIDSCIVIVPATLTLFTGSATKEYDGTALTAAFDPSTGAGSISGLASNESITVTTTGSQTEVGESANTYTIDWGTTNPNNYEISDNLGVLKVTPAPVTVTADNKSKTYGDSDPELTATVSGLQNNDAASVITYTLNREPGDTVGTYAITPSGAIKQGNYNITYLLGVLTIVDDTLIVVGTLETVTVNGCTASDAPAPYTTVEGLESGGHWNGE